MCVNSIPNLNPNPNLNPIPNSSRNPAATSANPHIRFLPLSTKITVLSGALQGVLTSYHTLASRRTGTSNRESDEKPNTASVETARSRQRYCSLYARQNPEKSSYVQRWTQTTRLAKTVKNDEGRESCVIQLNDVE